MVESPPTETIQMEQSISEEIPEDEVVTAVCSNEGDVLFIRSKKSGRKWELPTGRVEAGESPADAVKRELHEETGLTAHSIEPVVIFEFIDGDGMKFTQHVFSAEVENTDAVQAGSDAADAKFLGSTPDEVSFGSLGRQIMTEVISEV